MVYERTLLTKPLVVGDSLDSFVSGQMQQFSIQTKARNSAREYDFQNTVKTNGITLPDQVAFRESQLAAVAGDKDEEGRIRNEISNLKSLIRSKEFSDGYTQKLINFESGITSLDTVISWLKDQQSKMTDPTISDSINKELLTQSAKKFDLQKNIINAHTQYAINDKSAAVIGKQISEVSSARSQALLGGQDDLVAIYDLQLQSLNDTLRTNTVENDLKSLAARVMSSNVSAVGQLDAYNSHVGSAASDGPVTINGIRYDSAKDFWTQKRDSFVADNSANGFFGELKNEKLDSLRTASSQGMLNPTSLSNSVNDFSSLVNRPELANYQTQLVNTKQDVIQQGTDAIANTIYDKFTTTYDINAANKSLADLKTVGGNVEATTTKILNDNAQIKEKQVAGINAAAQSIIQNTGADPARAIDEAAKSGAGTVVSPVQSANMSAEDIAKAGANTAQTGNAITDPRTTITTPGPVQQDAANPTPPSVASNYTDLTSKYGKIGNAIYRKSDNHAFANSQEFFADSGQSTFNGLTFDTNYKVPTTPTTPQTPSSSPVTPTAAAPKTYVVKANDTLSGISKSLYGDATQYTKIAKANNLANPNLIKVGQELIIPT